LKIFYWNDPSRVNLDEMGSAPREALATSAASPRKAGIPMQRFWDKWGLWVAFVVVGSVIAYGLFRGLTNTDRAADAASKPGSAIGK
jgi:hypothetical protein